MTERGNTYQIYGTYVEHDGRFAQAIAYHPLDRTLHHVFEFDANYAIKTEITSEARIMLGTKVIDTKCGSNDFYGVGTSIREVASHKAALVQCAPFVAAQQFAADSHTALGDIRYANQGIFVILPRDQAPGVNEGGQLQKIVRVVSTVQYLLE